MVTIVQATACKAWSMISSIALDFMILERCSQSSEHALLQYKSCKQVLLQGELMREAHIRAGVGVGYLRKI